MESSLILKMFVNNVKIIIIIFNLKKLIMVKMFFVNHVKMNHCKDATKVTFLTLLQDIGE